MFILWHKYKDEVGQLIVGATGTICSECIDLCLLIFAETNKEGETPLEVAIREAGEEVQGIITMLLQAQEEIKASIARANQLHTHLQQFRVELLRLQRSEKVNK